jgi:hypothetical protein
MQGYGCAPAESGRVEEFSAESAVFRFTEITEPGMGLSHAWPGVVGEGSASILN